MKKMMLTFVGAVGMTAGAAQAQGSVTIYGVVDAGIVRESGGVAGPITKLTSGVESGSRLGFKGVEDLGGGMAAFFILESGFTIDTGALGQGGALFGRTSVVGLRQDRSAVTLGRQYTPLANAQVENDPFVTGLAGQSSNLISAGGVSGNNRMTDTVKYTYGGVTGLNSELAYGFGEVAGSSTASRQLGAAIGYGTGALNVKLAWASVNSSSSANGRDIFLGARYNFGAVTGYLNYAINKNNSVMGTVNKDSRDYLVGAVIPVAVVHKFIVSYIKKQDRTAQHNDASQIGLGYTYALSKRTDLYATYAHIRNHAAAGTTGFYTVGNATELGSGNQAMGVGIRHLF
ncbi:porin [Herbaspirillum rhizosphaerae]|uniref:porin n=1 Tax=Herbaspirillum rhizosphaerae TaxID=346179 RepID=UPI00067BA366|nr:porin [Herbaspirillum rhizosphaerae]